jgi:tetratricopeptide (TPR) repeat protein
MNATWYGLIRQLDISNTHEMTRPYLEQALLACEAGDETRIVERARTALLAAHSVGDWEGEAAALAYLAAGHILLGNADQALDECRQAQRAYRHALNHQAEGLMAYGLGLIYQHGNGSNLVRAVARYNEALDLFERALRYYAGRGDRVRWTALQETCREVRGHLELLADG